MFTAIAVPTSAVTAARQRSDRARREAERRYRLLVENVRDHALFMTDPGGTVTSWDVGAERLLGYSEPEALGKPVSILFTPEDVRDGTPEQERERASAEGTAEDERWHVRKDGSRFFSSGVVNSVRDEAGNLRGFAIVMRDVTERKRAEDALLASEARFRSVFEHAAVGMSIATLSGRFVRVNQAYCEITGYTEDELLAIDFPSITHPDDREANLRMMGKLIAGEVPGFDQVKRYVKKGGAIVWVQNSVSLVRDAHGGPENTVALTQDITERKRAEDALRERERWLSRFAESDIIGINVADVHGVLKFANDAYLRITGYSRDDFLAGRVRWDELTPPEWRHTEERAIAEAKRRGACTPFEKEYVRKDGTRVPVLVGFVLTDDAREEGVAFVLDLTERKRAERAAQEAREAAEAASRAKDAFLAALSHELRTPLTPALVAVSALEADPGSPPAHRDELGMIRRNVEMEARLIDDLLDLTKITQGKMPLAFDLVDAHAKIRDAVEICRGDVAAKRLTLRLGLRAERRFVRADPGRLQQVLWNLVKNAVKFTPAGGRIAVTTADGPGGRLTVRVIDTGVGIAPEALPKVFDAFEQGHREFGGLGLGLAIAKRLVAAHGGTLTASSEGPGRGAVFTVELEGAAPPPGAAPAPPAGRPAEAGRRALRILLVDDHRDTLRALAKLLRTMGHEVRTADGLAAALAEAESGGLDLLISDLGLPDGDGCELMTRLKPLPGIALTGFGMDGDVRRTREAGFGLHLTKPIDALQLEAAIRQLTSP
jgi:PAS domain S-box-containing protein